MELEVMINPSSGWSYCRQGDPGLWLGAGWLENQDKSYPDQPFDLVSRSFSAKFFYTDDDNQYRDETYFSKSHDCILWELSNHGKMTKKMLRKRTGIRKAELDIILTDLEREGRIIKAIGEDDELISLKDRF